MTSIVQQNVCSYFALKFCKISKKCLQTGVKTESSQVVDWGRK